MHRNNIIIVLIIVLIILYLLTNRSEHLESSLPMSNEAIQNIASVYADTKGTVSFNNLNVTGWKGMITMWSGDVLKIPTGWALCDGTNGTPDLRGRFVLGYNPTQQTDASGSTPRKQRNMNATGGNEQLIANIGFNWWAYDEPPFTWGNTIIYDAMKEGGLNILTDNTTSTMTMTNIDGSYNNNFNIVDEKKRILNRKDSGDPKGSPRPVSVTGRYTQESLPPYYVLAYIMKL